MGRRLARPLYSLSPPAYISSSCSPAIPYPSLSFFLFFPSLLLARFLQMTPSTFRKEGEKRMDSYRGNPLPRRQEHKRQKVKNKDGNKKEGKGPECSKCVYSGRGIGDRSKIALSLPYACVRRKVRVDGRSTRRKKKEDASFLTPFSNLTSILLFF